MAKRKPVVAGNWKMNTSKEEANQLSTEIISQVNNAQAEVLLFPPFVYLSELGQKQNDYVAIGAQNFHPETKGAFTGEISLSMLESIGIRYVLIGHSERRTIFNESDDFLAKKVDRALLSNFSPVFCCGEPLSVRETGNPMEFVNNQLTDSLFHLQADQAQRLILAYEPIWAIGTGLTASPQQAQEMHASIRQHLAKKWGEQTAHSIRILYGGSVKPANAKELFSQPDVDGGLVGGASLKADSFMEIIKAAE